MSQQMHTAALRGPTGFDEGARLLIMSAVSGDGRAVGYQQMLNMLFRDRFGSPKDYFVGVHDAHGYEAGRECERAIDAARDAMSFGSYGNEGEELAKALLLAMPESDFMLAIEDTLAASPMARDADPRITRILEGRGIPYSFDREGGFQWTGDAVIDRELIAPALAAINQPPFSGAVRPEFEVARRELRHGTALGRKQAVHKAGCALESAMIVVLKRHNVAYQETDSGHALFGRLEKAGLIPHFMEPTIFAVLTPRNKRGGHGDGEDSVDPGEAEASSVVATAAGAIAYLHAKL
jgi:hypothetical protein